MVNPQRPQVWGIRREILKPAVRLRESYAEAVFAAEEATQIYQDFVGCGRVQ